MANKKSKKQSALAVQPPVQTKIKQEEPKTSEVDTTPSKEYDPVDRSLEVFLWLMAYSVLMFSLPFLGFYGVRSWLDESFPELSTFQVNCYSVLTAVLVVNAIVAMYVLKAMREKDPPPLPNAGNGEEEEKEYQQEQEIKKEQ